MFRNNTIKIDYLGAVASFICLIHCMATPLLFVAKACSMTCCENAPLWWRMIDYVFLLISFGAIRYSLKTSTKKWVGIALWTSWGILLLTVLNESIGMVSVPENIVYLPAFALIVLHLYNQKYCKCSGKACCIR